MAEKTIRDFQVPYDVSQLADGWAAANKFGLKGVDPDGSRNYQRGDGVITGVKLCTVRQAGPHVRVEAWIHATLLARICALFLIPTDMSVESGGVRGIIPRSECRNSVNQLLVRLGQPPIG